ncbi:MAG: Rap1a/Tai family immunity protein [Luminiphilus sp.]|jgi:hypothetical protein|nr:Rap1a/Tai family immunity protein [Luminiphilus sp.]
MKLASSALFTALLFSLSAQHATASYYSAKGVVANCTSETSYDSGWCAGYIGSWADADIDRMRRKACIPAGTGLGTLKQVLMDYATTNATDMDAMTGGELLQRAFSRKWPPQTTNDTVSEIYRKTC